ncbi:MAG: hypothetical protein Q8P18_31335 [Pseudomonadota bacterium]|nr:hypothetical protein [Pseudomonadota bacterium]
MILFVLPAMAGLLDTLTPEERQVVLCQQVATPAEVVHDYARAAGVWGACLAESRRTGQDAVSALLADQLGIIQARASAAAWRTADPNRYAIAVLTVAADQRSTYYPGTDIADVFRAWMQTEAGKARLEPARTITLVWEGVAPEDEAEARTVAELFRRHVSDLGLKWADPGHPDVDVIVYATLSIAALDPATSGPAGALSRAEARFEATRVRFRTLDDTTDGFRVGSIAEEAEAGLAREAATRAVCERAAARLLKQVLRAVLK